MKKKDTFKRYIAKIKAHLDLRFPIGAILGVGLIVWSFYQVPLNNPYGIELTNASNKELALFLILICWYVSFFLSYGFIKMGWIGFKKTIFKNTKRQTTVVKLMSYKPDSYIIAQTIDGNIVKLSGFDPDKVPHCFLKEDINSIIPIPTEIFYEGDTTSLQNLREYKTARRCFLKKVNRG